MGSARRDGGSSQRAKCTKHPDRNAIAINDEGTHAMCPYCYREWMKTPVDEED